MNNPNSNLVSYYAARAAEYERIYGKPERQADLRRLERLVARDFAGLDVLEVACGTGYWTQFAARSARSIKATDWNQEVLQLAEQKNYADCRVSLSIADAFSPGGGPFNAGLAAFWWSHIRKDDVARFLRGFHEPLEDRARVVLLDNRFVEGSSTPISRTDDRDNSFQLRTLEDGSRHEVLKNFPTEAELADALETYASNVELIWLEYYWLARYRCRKPSRQRMNQRPATRPLRSKSPFDRVQQSLDHLLREQGDYVPVDLLMREGILQYADFEAWCCGRVARLAPVFAVASDVVAKLLEYAEQCAMRRGLEPYVNDYHGWDRAAGKRLRFSDDAKLQRYLHTHYRRAQAQPQMDLFADSEENYLVNGIIEALCRRLPHRAMELLDDLRRVAPDQPAIAALNLLAKAQAGLSDGVLCAEQSLQDLEESIAPVADRWLGSASRDFLVPFWRRLSESLAGRAFDAQYVKLHPSYAMAKAQDWAGVRAAVQMEKDWQAQAVLLARHAQSCAALRQEAESLQSWFRLCWHFPDEVAPRITSLADYAIEQSWQGFQELEPELAAAEFPAWLLLHRVGLVRSLPRELPGVEVDGHVVYATVHDLMIAAGEDQDMLSKSVINLRAQLKRKSPHLFVHYMRQFAAE